MAIEEPKYDLVLQDNNFEVRDYVSVIVAEVTVGGERSQASSAGFQLLANYIFGGNQGQDDIAMTAPVTQSALPGTKIAMTAPVNIAAQSDEWTVQFTMPSEFTLETLPAPNNDRVTIKQLPATRMAVLKFSGFVNEETIEKHHRILQEFMADNGLDAGGDYSLARYDPPWKPWFLRRNEIMIPIKVEADE